MPRSLRQLLDKLFTGSAGLSVVLMAVALAVILGVIFYRGSQAVIFEGTVEWRLMQLARFGRGDDDEVRQEAEQTAQARRRIYEIMDTFGRALDPDALADKADNIYRQYRRQVRNRIEAGRLEDEAYIPLRNKARDIRYDLIAAYESTDTTEAEGLIEKVLAHEEDPAFTGTIAEGYFELAREYRRVLSAVDLSRREEYAEDYVKLRDLLRGLFGPRPGEEPPPLERLRYGATRWDEAQGILHRILYVEEWVSQGPGQPLRKTLVPRREKFEGTAMVEVFDLLEDDLESMLHPRRTVYLNYFTDAANAEGVFGGAGPEIWGTFMLAGLAILMAFPLGLVAAAFLVECTSGGPLVRLLRMCINTLAGVPSIVFGLFGLAAIVMFFQPKVLGWESNSTTLAGGMTLGLLVLPIIIRASEEAIRSVPKSYREASLALGAGKLRTFLTVTFPAALPGILTGVILSLGRAAGETAPILFTAAVAVGDWATSLKDATRCLPYSSYQFATSDRLASTSPHVQWGMIMTLVLLVLVLNLAAIVIRWRISRRLRGG
ncbi:MAG: phosphate ABC transporter permease PstA [Phycisphaerae bacterium]